MRATRFILTPPLAALLWAGTAAAQDPAAGSVSIGAAADGRTLAYLMAVNRTATERARLAVERGSHPEVRLLAGQLLGDHTTMAVRLDEFAAARGIAPAPSELDRGLQEAAASTREAILSRRGMSLDRAYLAGEIDARRSILAAVEESLLPGAADPGLASLLQEVSAGIRTHIHRLECLGEGLVGFHF